MQFTSDIRRVLDRAGGSGSTPLDEESATRLWGAILDGALDEMEVGAVVAALAVGGATRDEIVGLYRAASDRITHWAPVQAARAVAIPAYGLVPGEALAATLAALLLRRFGVPVIMHGILDSPCGVSAARVLRELGVLPCASLSQAQSQLDAERIAFLPVQLVSPAIGVLLALRARLGVENCAHLVAQALDPTHGAATRLAFCAAGTASERFDTLAAEIEGELVLLARGARAARRSISRCARASSACTAARASCSSTPMRRS